MHRNMCSVKRLPFRISFSLWWFGWLLVELNVKMKQFFSQPTIHKNHFVPAIRKSIVRFFFLGNSVKKFIAFHLYVGFFSPYARSNPINFRQFQSDFPFYVPLLEIEWEKKMLGKHLLLCLKMVTIDVKKKICLMFPFFTMCSSLFSYLILLCIRW